MAREQDMKQIRKKHGAVPPRQIYEAEGPWIGGRSASPTGCAFAHIPTGTTANHRINVDEEEHRSDAMTAATSAIVQGKRVVRALQRCNERSPM